MTNHHVFENEGDAADAVLQFNYELTADRDPAARDEWECDPTEMFRTNPRLDYSIVCVKQKDGQSAGDVWGPLDLRRGITVARNQRVNIIQHPQGRFKEIVFRENQVKAVSQTRCLDRGIVYCLNQDFQD